ncbi:hypothetical protein [Dactylosporangium matsuzakiense]|uniref:Fibronectin type-III domain-containing protein n=1 Tax=Dactylosporangium matsuzakiense TaxID=53360 RepID=A0A9W6NMI9_9ACTN|nr:hypothetical protein [Dactylosporangium matsuzakiense]GLL02261.1 hypothetical protein GCM10017581_040030 [Dactylosporangium matsuzakiense]
MFGPKSWRTAAVIAATVVCGIATAPQTAFASDHQHPVRAHASVSTGDDASAGAAKARAHHKKKPTREPARRSAHPAAGYPGGGGKPTVAATATGKPHATGTTHATDTVAAPDTARKVNAPSGKPPAHVETTGVQLTATWDVPSVEIGTAVTVDVSIDRPTTGTVLSGLGYTFALPAGLTFSNSIVYRTSAACSGADNIAVGATTVTLSGWQITSNYTFCHYYMYVTPTASGLYTFNSANFTGLTGGGMTNGVTAQTLTVTATPKLTGTFTPATINSGGTSTLNLHMARTDGNPTGSSTGLNLTVALPGGLTVGTGSTANTCGGTFAASGASVTLTGASMTGTSTCDMSVPVTSSTPATYSMPNTVATTHDGIIVDLGSPCVQTKQETSCGTLALEVVGLAQTVTFEQPQQWSLSKGTITVTGTASSSLPVAFTSTTPAVCTVSGTTVTLVAAGTCTIDADQAGDATYAAATTVSRSFTVDPATMPPTAVTAAAGVSSVTVSWAAPASTTNITGYKVIATPGPATCTTTALTCVLGGRAGTAYTYTVTSLNDYGDSVAAGPSNTATPTAPVFPATPPSTNLPLTTDQGTITTAAPSQRITVIGTGFAPYSTASIVIYSDPITLGTTVTDGTGSFSTPVTLPAALAAGPHQVIASGVDPSGAPRALKLAVTVARAGSGSSLPVTGTDTAVLLLIGLGCTTTGGTLLLAGARRRTATV